MKTVSLVGSELTIPSSKMKTAQALHPGSIKAWSVWNRSESARLQGISEGKSTINRRLDGNEMIMMPSAFGKECTNVLLALKGCCILERCVCRLKMWLRYLPQDKLVPVPYIAFWEFRVTLRVLCLTLRYACAICFWCGVATILF